MRVSIIQIISPDLRNSVTAFGNVKQACCLAQMLEKQVEVRKREVEELQSQAHVLQQEGKDTDEVDGRREVVEKKLQELLDPLQKRKNFLMASREIHQFNRDVEDEIVSRTFVGWRSNDRVFE